MVARNSWLFPEPDSPTMPTHSPSAMSKLTPFTACTVPSGVANVMSRFFTERTGSAMRLAVLGVERVAQTVADEVEAKQRQRHEARGENQRPGRGLHLACAFRDQHPPGGEGL